MLLGFNFSKEEEYVFSVVCFGHSQVLFAHCYIYAYHIVSFGLWGGGTVYEMASSYTVEVFSVIHANISIANSSLVYRLFADLYSNLISYEDTRPLHERIMGSAEESIFNFVLFLQKRIFSILCCGFFMFSVYRIEAEYPGCIYYYIPVYSYKFYFIILQKNHCTILSNILVSFFMVAKLLTKVRCYYLRYIRSIST